MTADPFVLHVPGARAIARWALVLALAAPLGLGCAQLEANPKAALGGLGGAAAGGLLGSALGGGGAGIAAGVLLGGLLGGAVGNALDQRDKELAMKTAQTALETSPTGRASAWKNPDSGNSGTITPVRTYQKPSGGYCREYQQEITVGGKREQSYGTACRQPDGTWKIQN